MTAQLLSLWVSFLQIGLFSIGGGYATIPLIQEQVVNLHGWLNAQEFTDIITISQMTPGPIAVNTSTFVGIRIAGIAGAVIATFGCVLSGFLISICLFRFFQKHRQAQFAVDILKGLRTASVGLIASAACTILSVALAAEPDSGKSFNLIAAGIFVISLFALRKWKCNPILLMVLTGIAGFVCYRMGNYAGL